VYHHFDVELGTMLWIVTKGGMDLLEQYEGLVGPDGRPEDKLFQNPGQSFASSLSTHLLVCHWSTEDWRWYIRWLEEVLDHEVSPHSAQFATPLLTYTEQYGGLRPKRRGSRPQGIQALSHSRPAALA
jgi:hypothetical protein